MIDFSKGNAGFVAFQQPGWHGLGKTFHKDITVDDALRESGQDFTVIKSPNIHRLPDGLDILSNTSFFTYRADTNGILGSRLGSDYTVYQNIEALAVVNDLLETGKCKIETAGSVDEGRKVFICLKLQDGITVGTNDLIYQYVLIANSHDGTLAISVLPTNVRVVCNNTLSAALSGAKNGYKIRHTANAADRVKESLAIMRLLETNQRANSAAYNVMKCNAVDKQEFFDYIGNIFMTEDEIKKMQKGDRDALSTRKKNIIGGVLDFADRGIGQREALGNNLNMWYAYNAVTGYLTGKKYSSADDRFNSLILGDSAAKIKAAGELAMSPHNIRPLRSLGSNLILN
jgi:phage/plasmid-like protein (TIGR03299 family)